MKNRDLILKVKAYLDQKPEERDLQQGASLVLQLTNNRIMYANFLNRPRHYAARIEYELQKKYNFFVQELTHDEVVAMEAQAQTIIAEHHLDTAEASATATQAADTTATPSAETEQEASASASADTTTPEEFKKGKRADHASLPEEIQALYAENLSLLQRMRNVHTKLQLLSTAESPCPDSERYPFLQELISLDKQYHANWERYDHYVARTAPVVASASGTADSSSSDSAPSAETSATPAATSASPAPDGPTPASVTPSAASTSAPAESTDTTAKARTSRKSKAAAKAAATAA